MKTVRMTIDVQNPIAKPVGRIDAARFDATNEGDIAKHKLPMTPRQCWSRQLARRVRRRLGSGQAEFAKYGDVSLDTIRNWEQGKRSPTGAAKALLRYWTRRQKPRWLLCIDRILPQRPRALLKCGLRVSGSCGDVP